MKIFRILCLSATTLLPLLAQAALPFSKDGFGIVEATLDFCAQANPTVAGKYEERKKALVRDLPEKEVAEARASHEYKQAYDTTSTELAKVPKGKAVEACAASLKEDQ